MQQQNSNNKVTVIMFTLVLLCALLTVTHTSEDVIQYDYVVVGAGPSGLQMGYFLQNAGRNYVVMERANHSGSFFSTYPRHDTLISINKRHTGKKNKEFNMRHDWNSLLSHDESLQMRHYSKEMFPHKKHLVRYLNDFEKKLNINVQHNTEVQNISHSGNMEEDYRVSFTDQTGRIYKCRTLIIATGIDKPVTPNFKGSEHTVNYQDMSLDPDDYEGKTVLILGRGNTAFEVANSLYGATNLIHMVGRSQVRLSWETHYVGDLRAVNNALLDTYQLKSLDAVLEAQVEEVDLVKTAEGQFKVQFKEDTAQEDMFDNFAMREPYDVVISCLGWTFDDAIFKNSSQVSRGKYRKKKFPLVYHDYRSADFQDIYYAGLITHFIDFRKSAGGFIHGFRYTAKALHNILEYQNHGVPWPHIRQSTDQLISTIIKRVNEASGTYQMFSVLCDVILLSDDGESFDYYLEYPLNLIQRLSSYTGAQNASRMIVVVFEYGKDFSGPGKDVFRTSRATGEPSQAHSSNFLHPVFYYYKTPPSIEQMIKKEKDELLPKPDRLHHIVEDFLTEFTAPTSHILPLRRFLEAILNEDRRQFFAEDCMLLSMTHTRLPRDCLSYLSGDGVMGEESYLHSLIL